MNLTLNNINSDEVGQFEHRLKSIFKPIQPDSGYVQKLKHSLIKKAEIFIEQDNPAFYLLLVIVGLIITILTYLLASKKSNSTSH